jgi:hypothetical protein
MRSYRVYFIEKRESRGENGLSLQLGILEFFVLFFVCIYFYCYIL